MSVHDYTLYFIGSPWCGVSYYTYISVGPYYVVIQLVMDFVNLMHPALYNSSWEISQYLVCLYSCYPT